MNNNGYMAVNAAEAKAKSEKYLKNAVSGYRILIDTCSLLDENADRFWEHMVPLLQAEGKHIAVPVCVLEEVDKFARDRNACQRKSDPEGLHRRARKAVYGINKLLEAGLVELYSDPDDKHADNVMLSVLTKKRLDHNLMLITQDKALAQDMLRRTLDASVVTDCRLRVARINRYGYLSEVHYNGAGSSARPGRSRTRNSRPSYCSRTGMEPAGAFALGRQVTIVSGTLPLTAEAKEGDVLTAVRGNRRTPIRLKSRLNSGGEGTIYTTEIPDLVAKLYKREQLDCAKLEKLRLMLTRDIVCEGICYPVALLYNEYGEFVGYLMPQARGRELQSSVFNRAGLAKHFPDWNRIDTVTLAVTILRKLIYLHDCNIILGDINPRNILVESPTEVYFVDTDSYQIEGYPCPVGTDYFTAPEIQGKVSPTLLRTMGNERFAVATLLFMLMVPGKPPYSKQEGEGVVEDILNGDFSYPLGEESNRKAPLGQWRFCWSHMTYNLKEAFYKTFRKGEAYCAEQDRLSDRQWLMLFEDYLTGLKNGKLIRQDDQAILLFPNRVKRNVKRDREREAVYETRVCIACSTEFDITVGEKECFEHKGLLLPKRCPKCREVLRQRSEASGKSVPHPAKPKPAPQKAPETASKTPERAPKPKTTVPKTTKPAPAAKRTPYNPTMNPHTTVPHPTVLPNTQTAPEKGWKGVLKYLFGK